LLKTLQKTIHPEAPVLISKGNVIADGFSKKLDHLRNLLFNSQSELDDMLKRESDRTKIPSLKIVAEFWAKSEQKELKNILKTTDDKHLKAKEFIQNKDVFKAWCVLLK